MSSTVYTKRFVRCPFCNVSEHQVEHLFGEYVGRTAGPWYCDDCGGAFMLHVSADGCLDVEKTGRRLRHVRVLLELLPQQETVQIEVDALEFDDGHGFAPDEEQERKHAFFYEEHTCPINWMRAAEEVRLGGDEDPHNLVRVMGVTRPS